MSFTYSKTRINSLGYRGAEIDLNKKEKTLFLGDSFTYGYLIDENETIPYYYGLEFTDSPGINGGVPSYGLDHLRVRYMRSPLKGDLDFVIVILIKEDFYRPIDKKVNSPERVILRQFKKISVLASVVELELKRFATNLRIALYVLGFIKDEDFPPVQYEPFSDERNLQKLLDFDAEIKKDNSVPVFVFYEFEKSNYSESAETFCAIENLNCITDVPGAFAGMPMSGLKLYDNAHPSGKSNEVVAKHISNYIKQIFGVSSG
ncbi:MAG: SGNH/GDSL hydrolase family protein [archaeon]|nr:SGNH/GDSL hydrolase family protein [archaeon]